MKVIIKIAKTELQKLFYSPIAWLILIIFSFQVSGIFTEMMTRILKMQGMNRWDELIRLTWRLFASKPTPGSVGGVYFRLLEYLYLYIPLLTMNSMSREISTGSIKLLYSSPVTNRQIIFGKYLALMAFGAVMIAILAVLGCYAMATVEAVEVPLILSGLLGVYLLICTYAAIGLFMSSLTSYSVVAAIGTLSVLAFLNYADKIWQEMALVREITYWFAVPGKVKSFIDGLITTEGLLYFMIVIGLFLSFTIIKLQSGRQRVPVLVTIGKYAGVFMLAMTLGYFSSRPAFKGYADITRTQMNTLSKTSQEIIAKLKQPVTITTYTNVLDEYKHYSLALPISIKMILAGLTNIPGLSPI